MTNDEKGYTLACTPGGDRRLRYAKALAKAAGSKAFDQPGTEWDHARDAWYAHADAVMAVDRAELERMRRSLAALRRAHVALASRAGRDQAELGLLRRGRDERVALLEEARDALEAAGITEAHGGESWPRLVPAIEQLAAERDRAVEAAKQLQADLDRLEEETVGDLNEKNIALARHAETAEGKLDRLRKLADRIALNSPWGRWVAQDIRAILDPPEATP
ncbi:hypothetical protein ACWGDX_24055 [Streptomyces sp. NPDC055025]